MKTPLPLRITTFDASPYEELQRPDFPEKILDIEKAVRQHFAETLTPQGQSHHHDTPPICLNVHDGSPGEINHDGVMQLQIKNFVATSAAARIKRIEEVIGAISARNGMEKMSAVNDLMVDGTLCLDIFEHPECLDAEFAATLEATRQRHLNYLTHTGLILQVFHPLTSGKPAPKIPPALSLRRMHKGDRVFLATKEERDVHEQIFGKIEKN